MKLYYHNDSNFGDALNPLLFDILLPNFFDGDPSEMFIGIGSILGLDFTEKETKKIHIFSSGFAYGNVPDWSDIEVNCMAVRGPLTAQKLNLPVETAITDGGILTDLILPNKDSIVKKYKYGYMPHHYSLEKYDGYERLCEQLGIKFINPIVSASNSIINITEKIQETEVLIAEALHGAIVAESLRVPYIPVRGYKHINTFKWQDFGLSMGVDLTLNKLPRLYSEEFLTKKLKNRIKLPNAINKLVYSTLTTTGFFNEDAFLKSMQKLMKDNSPYVRLSKDSVFDDKRSQLLNKIETLK